MGHAQALNCRYKSLLRKKDVRKKMHFPIMTVSNFKGNKRFTEIKNHIITKKNSYNDPCHGVSSESKEIFKTEDLPMAHLIFDNSVV